jgi:hypothetical protein
MDLLAAIATLELETQGDLLKAYKLYPKVVSYEINEILKSPPTEFDGLRFFLKTIFQSNMESTDGAAAADGAAADGAAADGAADGIVTPKTSL